MRLVRRQEHSSFLTPIEEKYAGSSLHVDSAIRVRTAQLSSLLPKKGLQEMAEREYYYTVDAELPVSVACNERSLGIVRRKRLAWMSVL